MTQIIDSLPNEYQERILCNYKNATSTIAIVRITNIPHWYLERIVFPNQYLLFEAVKKEGITIFPYSATSLFDSCRRSIEIGMSVSRPKVRNAAGRTLKGQQMISLHRYLYAIAHAYNSGK